MKTKVLNATAKPRAPPKKVSGGPASRRGSGAETSLEGDAEDTGKGEGGGGGGGGEEGADAGGGGEGGASEVGGPPYFLFWVEP